MSMQDINTINAKCCLGTLQCSDIIDDLKMTDIHCVLFVIAFYPHNAMLHGNSNGPMSVTSRCSAETAGWIELCYKEFWIPTKTRELVLNA